MFYLKIRSNLYQNAYLLAGSEPSPPGRNEAFLETRVECKQERKKRKIKEEKKNLRKTLERTEDYSEITHGSK